VETFMYTAVTEGSYFIVVDAFADTDVGTFSLTVTTP
jgi:hypothetical protein